MSSTGAAVNLQIEYEFFLGTSRCETDEMRAATDGRNVIDYLATHYGFEIDAHQEGGWEEGQDNYADVRFLGGTLTPGISENVGGLVWDSPDQFARLARHEEPVRFPPLQFIPLVLGYRTWEELKAAYPDVAVQPQSRLLVDTLFPQVGVFVYTVYLRCGIEPLRV